MGWATRLPTEILLSLSCYSVNDNTVKLPPQHAIFNKPANLSEAFFLLIEFLQAMDLKWQKIRTLKCTSLQSHKNLRRMTLQVFIMNDTS